MVKKKYGYMRAIKNGRRDLPSRITYRRNNSHYVKKKKKTKTKNPKNVNVGVPTTAKKADLP